MIESHAMSEGVLLIDKPPGPTSHDVVQLVRRKLGLQRVGHAGTLDPMARGLLIVLIGRATKHQQRLQGHEKTYEALLRLGLQTDTADATGAILRQADVPPLSSEGLQEVLATFQGPSSQTPPAYSAVKVHGRPAYWWMRRKRSVALPARTITIFELSLLEASAERIHFRVRCSAGTYVRTLAESIAQRLGTVGHLQELVRLSIGSWHVGQAMSLATLAQASAESLGAHLLPVDAIDGQHAPAP